MIKISDVMSSMGRFQAAQRALDHCRQRAQGDVEYFSFSFVQDFKQAGEDLEQTLNAYIDQRVAQKLEQLKAPALFEQPLPAGRPVALAA